jgi:polar amino acid transport system permease protein
MNIDALIPYLPFILSGIGVTLLVMVLALAVAMPTAAILALARDSGVPLLAWPAGFIIELFRGSSALVQLFWAFYVLPLFGVNLSPLTAGVMVLGLNEGSYFSEVVRAGLNAVPAGQREAAIALQLSPAYRFFRIVLPQALPLMIPPFGNAVVSMLKFTALVSLVTVQDLSFRADLVRSTLGDSATVFSLTLIVYFILSLILGGGTRLLERYVNRRAGRTVNTPAQNYGSNVPDWAIGAGK